MRARLTKDFTFEAAQTLPKAPEGHKCRRVHGHSFKVEVSVEGDVEPTVGWIYDHATISAAMKPLLEILDHVLNSGVVIHGSLVISLAGVDLVYLGLNVVLTSVETALTNLQIEEKRRQK